MKTATLDRHSIVIEKIRSGKVGRDDVLAQLFNDENLRSSMHQVLSRMGSSPSDFEMIFNSSLMQFVKTVIRKKDLKIKVQLNTYLIGIGKNVFFNLQSKESRNLTEPIEDFHEPVLDVTPESLVIDQDRIGLLHEILEKLGAKCREVLMHWANGYKMAEIATMMQYKSDMMAKKKKHQCFHKLMDYVSEHPEVKEVLR